jgi:hypothetical protein
MIINQPSMEDIIKEGNPNENPVANMMIEGKKTPMDHYLNN